MVSPLTQLDGCFVDEFGDRDGKVPRCGPFADAARGVVVRPVARAEPATEVASVAQGHTAKVRTHTHHHQPFTGFVHRVVGIRTVPAIDIGVARFVVRQGRKVDRARVFVATAGTVILVLSMVLWALAKEIRTLYEAQLDCDRGQSAQQALTARRVWKNRMPLLQAALANQVKARQDLTRLERLHREDSGTISVRRLEVSRASLEQATAQVAKAEAESVQRRQIGLAEAEAIQARGEAEAEARLAAIAS